MAGNNDAAQAMVPQRKDGDDCRRQFFENAARTLRQGNRVAYPTRVVVRKPG